MLYLTPPQVKARTQGEWLEHSELNLKGKPMVLAASQLALLLSVVWAFLLSCL